LSFKHFNVTATATTLHASLIRLKQILIVGATSSATSGATSGATYFFVMPTDYQQVKCQV